MGPVGALGAKPVVRFVGYRGVVATEPLREEQALRAAYQATRAILRAKDSESAQRVIVRLCTKLGAHVVAADDDTGLPLPIDISVDGADPILLAADSDHVEGLVARYVVPAVNDARLVARFAASREMLTVDATRDALTGIWNRRSMQMAINRAIVGDCIALVDLDRFKQVNDTHGHAAGDEVLSVFADFLRRGLADIDAVGRLGGEEFVVLFPETALADAEEQMQDLCVRWAASAPYGSTFSAGVASVPSEQECSGERPGQMALAMADALMYEAKSRGRNRVVVQADDAASLAFVPRSE